MVSRVRDYRIVILKPARVRLWDGDWIYQGTAASYPAARPDRRLCRRLNRSTDLA